MPNIQFNYMYRDGANYKNHDEVIFSNPDGLSLEFVDATIRGQLIDGEWFYVERWKMKDLHFPKWDGDIDVLWHEFKSTEYTDEEATDTRTIAEFLKHIATTPNSLL